ncbi:MAG: AI-2E family transporter [Clostridium sp.]|nr:AI-2E family transporter [Clostridium sp.]
MKIDWNKKYNTIAVYTFIVAASIILFYLGISQIGAVTSYIDKIFIILQPFIIGFAIAYLLGFLLKVYERNLKKIKTYRNLKLKYQRIISLILTYLTAILLIVLFLQFVLPQLIESIVGLVNNIPTYISNLNKVSNYLFKKFDVKKEQMDIINEKLKDLIDTIINIGTNLLPVIGNIIASFASSIWNIAIGAIVSIYLLIDKENMCAGVKKVVYAILPKKGAEKVILITHKSNETFGKFLSGKILDSAIIGILAYIVLKICNMPYTLLISVVIGITNIIPFFGPFIGAVPSFIIILFVSPEKALWFLLIVFILQQVDGNIIGPKILGDSIGISAFWILFSIMVAGEILGFVGMVIGVPLFAVIYSLFKDFINEKLKSKGLKTDIKEYKNTDED